MKVLIEKTETNELITYKFKDFEVEDFMTEIDPGETLKELEEDLIITFSKTYKTVTLSDEVVHPFFDFPLDLETFNVHYLDYKYRTEKDDYTFLAFSHIDWKEEFEGKSEPEIPFSMDGRTILVCTKTKEILHTKDFKLKLERKEDFEKRNNIKI